MKKNLLILFLLTLFLSVSTIPLTAFAVEQKQYQSEYFMDVAEFMNTTEIFSEEGVSFSDGQTVLFERQLETALNGAFGIRFKTKFESNNWRGGSFNLKLGANEVICSYYDEETLRIDVYNRNRSVSANGQYIKAVLIDAFKANETHVWKLVRVFTTDTADNGYALRLFIDGKPVVDVEDDNVLKSGEFTTLGLYNNSGVGVTLKSSLAESLQLEAEQNVLDIMQFGKDISLLNNDGRVTQSASVQINSNLQRYSEKNFGLKVQNALDFVNQSSGVAWRMKTDGDLSAGDGLFSFEIGATQILVGYDSASSDLYANALSKWSGEFNHVQDIGNKQLIVSGYTPKAWHEWKIVRVKALNASGYVVRIYIDGELCYQAYSGGQLVDKDENGNLATVDDSRYAGIYLINHSGRKVYFKSCLLARPMQEKIQSNDISSYFTNDLLFEENGLNLNGSALTLNGAETVSNSFYAQSFAVEFNAKVVGAALNFKVGLSQLSFAEQNGEMLLTVSDLSSNQGFDFRKTLSAESEFFNVKVVRSRILYPTGKPMNNGYVLTIYLQGEAIAEIIEAYAPLYSENNNKLEINAKGDVFVKSCLTKTQLLDKLEECRNLAKTAVNEHIGALLQENYEALEWETIQSEAAKAVETINAESKIFELETHAANAINQINACKTKAQKQLDPLKQSAKQEVESYVNSSNYSSAAWEKICIYIQRALTAIDAAQTDEQIQAAVSACKGVIDLVSTLPEDSNQNQGGGEQGGESQNSSSGSTVINPTSDNVTSADEGCGSALNSKSLTLGILLMGLCAVVFKRKAK